MFLQATTTHFTFTEGDRTLSIGELSGVVLSDADRLPEVASLQITLEGTQENGDEFVFVNATPVTGGGFESGAEVSLNQAASLLEYQVSRRDGTSHSRAMFGLISMSPFHAMFGPTLVPFLTHTNAILVGSILLSTLAALIWI